MLTRTLLGASTALALALPAGAVDLTLFHTWSNESEMGALNTIIEPFKAETGNTVTAASVPHETAGREPAGQPLRRRDAAQPLHRRRRELLPRPEGEGAEPGRRAALRPASARRTRSRRRCAQAITIDGEVLKIPTAVHIDGMVYYNKKVAEAAGVDPTKWTSLEDMWADQQKVERRRHDLHRHRRQHVPGRLHLPPAAGRGRGARDLRPLLRRRGRTPDPTVFDEPGLRDTIEVFRRITAQTDEGWVNRAWNDTTNTVIAGTALMQIHGDWMKGQWRANGKELGRRLRLHQHPGHQGAVGDGRLLRHPRRRGRGDAEGGGGVRRQGRRPDDQRRVRLSQGVEPGQASTCRPTSSTSATRWCSSR